MGSKKYTFVLLLLTPLMLFSLLFHPLQMSAMPARNVTVAKIDQVIQYPLIATKTINATTIQVNQSLIVQINLKNLNTAPLYGIQLTEPRFASPIFAYNGLPNKTMSLGTIQGQSNITVFYLLVISQPIINATLPSSIVTYYTTSPVTNTTTLPLYTTYSPSVTFTVIPKNTNTGISENNLLIISGLFMIYSIIIIIRTLTIKFSKQNKAN